MGNENFIDTLSRVFPGERENIRRIVTQFKNVGDLISVETLRNQHLFSGDVLPYFNSSASAFLKENTTNQTLRNVIAGATILSGGEEENTPLYTFATILNSNIESSYRFVDGSQQVADLLIESIRAQGGVVRNRSEVTRLIVKDDRITGVEINRSEYIEGDSFISGIHPVALINILDKTKNIKKAYISRIHSLRNSTGFFTLSILLKKDAFPYLNRNYYYYDENNPWINPNYAECGLRKVFFCTSASSDSDSYAKVVQILEPMYWSEVAQWRHTSIDKRGDEYEAFKQQRAEELIDYIEQFHPGLKQAVEDCSTSTPLTYHDYTGTQEGSAYGIIKDYNDVLICLLPVKTKIPNLFIKEQNNNVHGMIGVFLTAMYTCSEFVGAQYLAKKVANV
jgi:phytoene dehydrogenase-like protein